MKKITASIGFLLSIHYLIGQITVTKTNVTCHDCTDGTAKVTVEGGTPPYEIIWQNGSTGNSIENLAPGYYVVVVVDANGCSGSKGFTIENMPEPPDPFTIPFVSSSDPNDISGPEGYGTPKWVSVKDALAYRIRFENDPKLATAPVNKVTITYPFDDKANMFSFRLGSFSFRSFTFQPATNVSHYSKRLYMADSIGVNIDVTAGIDVTQKRAFWIFQAIDPNTGLPNIDVNKGFLLINDSINRMGEGEVNFTITPKNTVNTGDTIYAFADIIFDTNDPLRTNTVFNTIDAQPPVSKILSAKNTGSDNIELKWQGTDEPKGSGLAKYKVMVSENNEPYSIYATLNDTTIYLKLTGGNEYKIQTIAFDNTNNSEKIKQIPDTILYLRPRVLLGKDVSICVNDSIELNAGGGFNTYKWNNGAEKQRIYVKNPGKYYVTAIKDTIISSDTIVIGQFPKPIPSLHSNMPEFCTGDSLILNAGIDFKNYLWNTQEISNSIKIAMPGKYWVTVTDKNGCTGKDSLTVRMNEKPLFSLGNDTTIKDKDTIILKPNIKNFIFYNWSNHSITDSIMVIGNQLNKGENKLWLKVTDDNNCSNTDTINLTVIPTINIEFENAEHTKVVMYPNPTSGILNLQVYGIENGKMTMELFNAAGSLLMIKEYNRNKTIIDQLDLSDLSSGAYLIKITYKNSNITRTIIKK